MKHFVIFLVSIWAVYACTSKTATEQSNVEDASEDRRYEDERVDTPFSVTATLQAVDGLEITYDRLHLNYDQPVILLCHQAGWSRGEYKATADSLHRLGFNCVSIDQRSGETVNDVKNETAARAKEHSLGQSYEDAEQDIVAALTWINEEYYGDVILMGSSYSAGLALKIGSEKPKLVDKVISFSPGEYYSDFSLKESIGGLVAPCFLTSSQEEANGVQELFKAIPAKTKIQFIPSGKGAHGSRVLWESIDDHSEYWAALKQFLGR